MKPRVVMGMPHYSGQAHIACVYRYFNASASASIDVVERNIYGSSLLAKAFNCLWAKAIQLSDDGKADYFVMQHADVAAEDCYVDKLVAIIQRLNADVVSAVIPLKDMRGITSTAIDHPTDRYDCGRRITTREALSKLPPTFCAADVDPKRALLINTGCWIADLRKPWVRKAVDGKLCSAFSIDDEISIVDGKYKVGAEPEDWRFSRYLHAEGARVYATTEVKVEHHGEYRYVNYTGWGTQKHDEDTRATWEAHGIASKLNG